MTPPPRDVDPPSSGIALPPLVPLGHLKWGCSQEAAGGASSQSPFPVLGNPFGPSPQPRGHPPLWPHATATSAGSRLSGTPVFWLLCDWARLCLPLPRPWTPLTCPGLSLPSSRPLCPAASPRSPLQTQGTHSQAPLHVLPGQGPGRLIPGPRSLLTKQAMAQPRLPSCVRQTRRHRASPSPSRPPPTMALRAPAPSLLRIPSVQETGASCSGVCPAPLVFLAGLPGPAQPAGRPPPPRLLLTLWPRKPSRLCWVAKCLFSFPRWSPATLQVIGSLLQPPR